MAHTYDELINIFCENYKELVLHALMIVDTKEMAEEIVMDLAEKIVRDYTQFSKAETIIAYYKTCIANAAKTRIKREKKIQAVDPEVLEYHRNKHANARQADIDLAIDLESLLEECTPQELRILELKYVYGYKLSEIAEILDSNANAVSQQLFRTRRKLEGTLKKRNLIMLSVLLFLYYQAS